MTPTDARFLTLSNSAYSVTGLCRAKQIKNSGLAIGKLFLEKRPNIYKKCTRQMNGQKVRWTKPT